MIFILAFLAFSSGWRVLYLLTYVLLILFILSWFWTRFSLRRMAFRRTGYRTGVASLAIDGREAGSVKLDETWPTSGLTAGLHVGRDGSTPVTDSYPFPFAFTGALDRIEIEVDESESADAGGDQRKLAHNGE